MSIEPRIKTRTSQETDQVYLALFGVQNAIQPVELDGYNPFTKSKYAKLPSILRELKPLLEKNNLLLIQLPSSDSDNQPTLVTRLVHVESNQWIEGEMSLTDVGNMQKLGGALTYGRRYSIAAIFNLVADEDDDGNTASGQGQKQQKPAGTQQPRKGSQKPPKRQPTAGPGNGTVGKHWSQIPANQTKLLEHATTKIGVSGAQQFFKLLDIKVEKPEDLAAAWKHANIKRYDSGKALLADVKSRFEALQAEGS